MPTMFRVVSLFFLLSTAPLLGSPFKDALNATVKLAGNGVAGTGFLIEKEGKAYLATASHVFVDFKGDECVMVYRAEREGKSSVRNEVELTIRKDEKPLWKKHGDHDIAVLAIELPEDIDCRPFPMDAIVGSRAEDRKLVHVGQEICVPCYPVKTEANEAGWPILRRGTIASHPLSPVKEAPTFFIDSASYGGESGAPVVARAGEKTIVVGVVTSMQRQTDTTKTPLEERTTHTPLGLGIAVQSAFLRDLLEK